MYWFELFFNYFRKERIDKEINNDSDSDNMHAELATGNAESESDDASTGVGSKTSTGVRLKSIFGNACTNFKNKLQEIIRSGKSKMVARNKDKRNILVWILLIIIAIDTGAGIYYYKPVYGIGQHNYDFRNSIAMSICHFIMIAIIYSWIYCAGKIVRWEKELPKILRGLADDKKCSRYGQDKLDDLIAGHARRRSLHCVEAEESFATSVKLIYALMWLVLVIIISGVVLPLKLGYVRNSVQGVITVVTVVAAMFLCMHSWWYCMEYGYFLSTLPGCKELVNYNKLRPSQTLALQKMIIAARKLAIAFLVSSMLLAIMYIAVVNLNRPVENDHKVFLILWMLLIMVPGMCSLIPVVIMPKIFITKLHRAWKFRQIEELEKRSDFTLSGISFDDSIDILSKDRIRFISPEMLGAILSIIPQLFMLLTTLK